MKVDCRAIWGAAFFKYRGKGVDVAVATEIADEVLSAALELAGQCRPTASEEIWIEVDRGAYDASSGLKPDSVFHDDKYWLVSYPGDPGGRWIRWDNTVALYHEGEQ